MSETATISGQVFKLESANGTLLGIITIPEFWADCIKKRGAFQFQFPSPIRTFGDPNDLGTFGILFPSFGIYGALILQGVSLEQFEQMEGCAFSPSAAYLRSIVG